MYIKKETPKWCFFFCLSEGFHSDRIDKIFFVHIKANTSPGRIPPDRMAQIGDLIDKYNIPGVFMALGMVFSIGK